LRRQRFNFWIDEELRVGLKAIRDRDGILESEQIRRAIRQWLRRKHVHTGERELHTKAGRLRSAARKRP
jgi:hypothetical protein